MKLNFLTFFIKDLDKSVNFFEELVGLKLQRRFEVPIGEIAFLANGEGETQIELIAGKDLPSYSGSGMGMSFLHTGDLEELRNKAISMGYEPTEIFRDGPGPVNFKVMDSNGILVEFGLPEKGI